MMKKLRLIVILSSLAMVLLAAEIVIGTVALRARLTPEKKKWDKAPLPGPMVTIGDQVYNLADHNRYLKATIVLEVSLGDAENPRTNKQTNLLMEELKKRDHKMRDIIIRAINAWKFDELNSPEGKTRFKQDVLDRLNEELSQGELKRVMFTEFALQ
jgi:flagellar FliL protein